MKNVAGYDAARLHVGAYGTLGVLLETSMKAFTLHESQVTVQQELTTAFDTSSIVSLMRQPLPISAAAIVGRSQYIRLTGSESAVKAAAATCGGEVLENDAEFWASLRELSHEFFKDDRALWRISVPEFTEQLNIEGDWLYDWAGAQRFLKTNARASDVFAAAAAVNGHATSYSSSLVPTSEPVFQPLAGAMQLLQSRVRDSFDQYRLFNPGRFHPELDQITDNRTSTVMTEN